MPLFIALHKWNPEDEITVTKEAMALFTAKLPEGVELRNTYETGAQRAFCVWVAPNKETLEKVFDQSAPVMKKGTEFVPVVQSFPPTMEYVLTLYQMMIKGAPK
jgi:hypothetical protein